MTREKKLEVFAVTENMNRHIPSSGKIKNEKERKKK